MQSETNYSNTTGEPGKRGVINKSDSSISLDPRDITYLGSSEIDTPKIEDVNSPEIYEITYSKAMIFEIQNGREVPIRECNIGELIPIVDVRQDQNRLYIKNTRPLQYIRFSHAKPYVSKTLTEEAEEKAKELYNWVSINPIKASIGAALMFIGAGIFISRIRQRIRNKKN